MIRFGVFCETLDRAYLNSLSVNEYNSILNRLYALMDPRTKICPFCDSSRVIKKGHSSNGSQRYACKSCMRGFIGSAVPNSHVQIDTWKVFCRSYLNGLSIHKCASRCGVCLKTAQYMKSRLVDMFRDNSSILMVFIGELQLDMTG